MKHSAELRRVAGQIGAMSAALDWVHLSALADELGCTELSEECFRAFLSTKRGGMAYPIMREVVRENLKAMMQ